MKGDIICETKRWSDFERMEMRRELGITCEEKIGATLCSYCRNKFLCAHIEVELDVKKKKKEQIRQ